MARRHGAWAAVLAVVALQVGTVHAIKMTAFMSKTCDANGKHEGQDNIPNSKCIDLPPVPYNGNSLQLSGMLDCTALTADSEFRVRVWIGKGCNQYKMADVTDKGKDTCVAPIKGQAVTIKVDCSTPAVYSSWSPWSACSQSCGPGTQQRTRTLKTAGSPTAPTSETRSCNVKDCPVACALSPWGAWTACSKTCGTGTRSQSRTVLTAPQHGGTACPTDLVRTEACGTTPCPRDCLVSAWTPYSACSEPCGGGLQRRTRTITTSAAFGGKQCPPLETSKTCNTGKCPVHCATSEWAEWSSCSKSCGGGTRTRQRSVTTAAAHGGSGCPHLHESDTCNAVPCPVDCKLSAWSAFSKCSVTCGEGLQSRKRIVETPAKNGGKACPGELEEFAKCKVQDCPVDCQLSAWSNWSHCSKSCGGGEQTRDRKLLVPASNGGKACDPLHQKQACNSAPCSVDCVLSPWSDWSVCSKTCGGGEKHRTRTVVTHPLHSGIPCGYLKATENCNRQKCPTTSVGEVLGGLVSKNNTTTGNGTTSSGEGKVEDRDCQLSAWSTFTPCSATCGNGTKTRTRTIVSPPTGHGKGCATLHDIKKCPTNAIGLPVSCPSTPKAPANATGGNCVVSPWSPWSVCSASCGDGLKARVRVVLTPAWGTGKPCPPIHEKAPCPTTVLGTAVKCPTHNSSLDCKMSKWSAWSPCPVTCGHGTVTRNRSIIEDPCNGQPCLGKPCGNLTERKLCSATHGLLQTTVSCTQECITSPWSKWSACSKSCGNGSHIRVRRVLVHATHGGKGCGALSEEKPCNTQACPHADCKYSAWSDWSECTARCGGGVNNRSRTIKAQPVGAGKACDPSTLFQKQDCNTQNCGHYDCKVLGLFCKSDCIVGPWSEWEACNRPCGGGVTNRTRKVTRGAKWGGLKCPPQEQTKECNLQHCPVPCETGPWSEWGPCSATCGSSVKTRTRTMTKPAMFGGSCQLTDTTPCNGLPECEAGPCMYGVWSSYSKCSKGCAGGLKQSQRVVALGGEHCDFTKHIAPCNTKTCASGPHCKYQPYGSWSSCRRLCGAPPKSPYGIRFRLAHPKEGSPLLCHNIKQEERCDMPVLGTVKPEVAGEPGDAKEAVPCMRSEFF